MLYSTQMLAKIETTGSDAETTGSDAETTGSDAGSVAEQRLLEVVKSQNPLATRLQLALIFTVRRANRLSPLTHFWTLGRVCMGRDVRLRINTRAHGLRAGAHTHASIVRSMYPL